MGRNSAPNKKAKRENQLSTDISLSLLPSHVHEANCSTSSHLCHDGQHSFDLGTNTSLLFSSFLSSVWDSNRKTSKKFSAEEWGGCEKVGHVVLRPSEMVFGKHLKVVSY